MNNLFPRFTSSLSRGNTIIEVMIAMLIIGTVMTALAATMTYSVKNTSEAQYRDIATRLASEPIEVLRHLRSTTNWQGFYTALPNGDRCITISSFAAQDVNSIQGLLPAMIGSCVGVPIPSGNAAINFARKVTVDNSVSNEIRVTSVVSWSRNDTVTSNVTLEQVFHNTGAR
jgi:Tfp pilus assembly protein PilV